MSAPRELDAIPSGVRRRTLTTARWAARVAAAYLRRRSGRPAPLSDATRIAVAADDLVAELGALKGLLMKFGQMASYLSSPASPEAAETMARLYAQGTPFAFDEIGRVVEEDLGGELPALFESIDRKPLAAASIGQVHRARWAGQDVAVKVQYPGIEKALRHDLAAVGFIARLGTFGLPMDGKALVQELRARIGEECDYRREARNQALFRTILHEIPGARVPAVILERSSRRVLTSELVTALDFFAFQARATREARNRAGAVLFRACFEAMFRRCMFNADPHPGNYLFDRDGSVTFLDFGCVRRFERAAIDTWKRLARAVLAGDRRRFEDEFSALGFVRSKRRFDWDHQWRAFRHLYRPYLANERFEFTPRFVRELHDLFIFENPNALRTAMPREWLMVNRLQWGLTAVLAELRAEGHWSEPFREAVESRTEPALEDLGTHGTVGTAARRAGGRVWA